MNGVEHLKMLLACNGGYDLTDFLMYYNNQVIDGDDAAIQIEITDNKEDYEIDGILLQVFKITNTEFQSHAEDRMHERENLYFLKDNLKEFEFYEIKVFRKNGTSCNPGYGLLYNMTSYDVDDVKETLISEMDYFSELFEDSIEVEVEVWMSNPGEELKTIFDEIRIEAEKYEKNLK